MQENYLYFILNFFFCTELVLCCGRVPGSSLRCWLTSPGDDLEQIPSCGPSSLRPDSGRGEQ
jgi:hypothetical protein